MIRTRRIRKRASKAKQRRGTVLVEFAVLAPVLFLFIFGMIELGRLTMVRQAITNAAREGCREAALITTTSESQADTVVRNALQGVIAGVADTAAVRVSCTPAPALSLASGTPIRVDVAVDVRDISWLPGSFLGIAGSATLAAEASQNRE